MKSIWIYLSLILGLAQSASARNTDTSASFSSLTTEQKIERLRQVDPWRAEMFAGATAWQQQDFVKAEAAGHPADAGCRNQQPASAGCPGFAGKGTGRTGQTR